MEITIDNTRLRVHEDGTIERYISYFKSMEGWKFVKGRISNGYLGITIHKKSISFHRLVAHCYLGLDLDSKLQVDHIDRNKLNNHVTNLRLVTITENSLNRVSTEDAKGYYITPSGYFRVIVNINNTTIKYGSYKSEYDAIRRFTYESEKINRLRMV